MPDTWALVHAERQALIDDLAALEDHQWETQSLCPGWSVHDVAAHLVDNAKATVGGMMVAMVRARFDFDLQNAQGVAREKGATTAETLGRLREVADRTSSPPASLDSRLVEEILHGEDIRRPLGLSRAYPIHAVVPALRYQLRTSVAMGGSKQRVAGVRLQATDADVAVGDGPEVVGSALSLLLVVSGRLMAAEHLDGPGVPHLS